MYDRYKMMKNLKVGVYSHGEGVLDTAALDDDYEMLRNIRKRLELDVQREVRIFFFL